MEEGGVPLIEHECKQMNIHGTAVAPGIFRVNLIFHHMVLMENMKLTRQILCSGTVTLSYSTAANM